MHIGDLLPPGAINLAGEVPDKAAAIRLAAGLIASTGAISDLPGFIEDLLAREAQGSTGLGEGIAIPHARSPAVRRPMLAAVRLLTPVSFQSLDGKPVSLIFMIAAPEQADAEHLEVLSHLSTLIADPNVREGLRMAATPAQFRERLSAAEKEHFPPAPAPNFDAGRFDLLAVTACPSGLSHTFLAAEALERKAREMGLSIKVEADGAAGVRNPLTREEIVHAKAVIVAADRGVDLDRFIGKPLIRSGVREAVRDPEHLITRALDPATPGYEPGEVSDETDWPMRFYRHLMSGLSYLMPLTAAVGILCAMAHLGIMRGTRTGLVLEMVGSSLGTLLFPVLSAFIAFSIAGRTALTAGFIGGIITELADAGVAGALVNGFVSGAVALVIVKLAARAHFIRGPDAFFALVVFPVLGALGTTLIAEFITNTPAAWLNSTFRLGLNTAPGYVLLGLGMVLGALMSADFGGPFNKLGYAIGVLSLANSLPGRGPGMLLMAAVMAGGMIPPLVVALTAGIFCRQRFPEELRQSALATACKGLIFITESAIPYRRCHPGAVIFACMVGSALAGGLAMYWDCGIYAPHGGIFILPLCDAPFKYALALLAGVAAGTALLTLILRLKGAARA